MPLFFQIIFFCESLGSDGPPAPQMTPLKVPRKKIVAVADSTSLKLFLVYISTGFVLIALVWSMSCLWIVPIVGWHHFVNDGVRRVPENVCDTEYATNRALKLITAVLNFYLPLSVMYGVYTKIFIEIRRRTKRITGQNGGNLVGGLTFRSGSGTKEPRKGLERTGRAVTRLNFTKKHASLEESLSLDKSATPLASPTVTELTDCLDLSDGQNLKKSRRGNQSPGVAGQNRDSKKIGEEIDLETGEIPSRFPGSRISSKKGSNDRETRSTSLQVNPSQVHQPQVQCWYCDRRLAISYTKDEFIFNDKTNTIQIINRRTEFGDSAGYADDRNQSGKCYCRSISGGSTFSGQRSRAGFKNRTLSPQTVARKRSKLGPITSSPGNGSLEKIGPPNRRLEQPIGLVSEIKAARQLGVILGAFTLCFVPYFVCFMVVAFCETCVGAGLMITVTWIGYLNSALNPFLYPLCNTKFRTKFRKMLRMRTSRFSSSTSSPTSHKMLQRNLGFRKKIRFNPVNSERWPRRADCKYYDIWRDVIFYMDSLKMTSYMMYSCNNFRFASKQSLALVADRLFPRSSPSAMSAAAPQRVLWAQIACQINILRIRTCIYLWYSLVMLWVVWNAIFTGASGGFVKTRCTFSGLPITIFNDEKIFVWKQFFIFITISPIDPKSSPKHRDCSYTLGKLQNLKLGCSCMMHLNFVNNAP